MTKKDVFGNIRPEIVQEDNWLHNMRTSVQDVKLSSPFNSIAHLVTKVGTDGKLETDDNSAEE